MYRVRALRDSVTGEEFLFVAKKIWYDREVCKMWFCSLDNELFYINDISLEIAKKITKFCFIDKGYVMVEYGVMHLYDERKSTDNFYKEFSKVINADV